MLDIRFIRENAERVQLSAEQKGYTVSIAKLLQCDDARRELQQQVDELRERRNQNASKMKGGRPEQSVIDEGRQIKAELAEFEGKLSDVETEYTTLLKKVPNVAHADVPVGASEDENVEVKVVGELPKFDFTPKNHYEIAQVKDWIDKERAANVSGARFAYLKGDLVKLQLALMTWVINTLSDENVLA